MFKKQILSTDNYRLEHPKTHDNFENYIAEAYQISFFELFDKMKALFMSTFYAIWETVTIFRKMEVKPSHTIFQIIVVNNRFGRDVLEPTSFATRDLT